MSRSKNYDYVNRLTSISSASGESSAATLPVSFAYQYNRANQRTRAMLGDGSYWVYQYDARGQVTSGKRYWQDGTPVAGQQFEYAQDDIGNRISTQTGGDASGGGLRSATYTRNRINQYTQRDVPGYADIMGLANPTASVTVNGNTAYRKGDYFDYALAIGNTSAPQYPTVTVTSTYGGSQTTSGKVYVPQTPEAFTYDADGNLTNDGRWSYTWDGENRLKQMMRDVTSPSGAKLRIIFEYDIQGRRIRKQTYTKSGSNWNEQSDTAYLYDGWNLVGELDANASNAKLRTYIWGTDLSGSMQGAGGVGGLLKVTDYVGGTTHHFVAHDGNGNVAALVDGTTGALTARYEYGPFGEALRATGTMAKKNPLRFSTKYTDDESAMLYYGYRYYNPSTGRWLSRDPIEEKGGRNLYAVVGNNPIDKADLLGLDGLVFETTYSGHFKYVETFDPVYFRRMPDPGRVDIVKWTVRSWIVSPRVQTKPAQIQELSCCWKLGVEGLADIRWFAIDGPGDPHDVHERVHLRVVRSVYSSMAEFVSPFAFTCFKYREIRCLKARLPQVVSAFRDKVDLENARFHVNGGYDRDTTAWESNQKWLNANEARINSKLENAKADFSTCIQ